MSGTVILLRGISGAGKTTQAATYQGAVHIEADSYRVDASGAYRFELCDYERVERECLGALQAAINEGAPLVVVDKCNLTWASMRPFAEAARSARYRVEVVTVACAAETAWHRNVHGTPRDEVVAMRYVLARELRLPGWCRQQRVDSS